MPSDHSDPRSPAHDPRSWDERASAQAHAFDLIGERYDEVFPDKKGQEEHVRRLLETLPAGSRVLDLGSGTGLPTARRLVDAGMRVTGFEISERMLELARRNVPEAEFHRTDIVDLDPDGTSYDAVVAFFSLLCLPRARIPEALARVREALVPGGTLCLSMVETDLDDAPIPFLGASLRVSGYPREELRRVVEAAGLAVEGERAVVYEPEGGDAPPETQVFLTCRRKG